MLQEIWHCQIPSESFGNLHSLHVESCASLLKFLPSFLLSSLQNLEVVILKNYDLLEEVFDLEGIDVNNEHVRLLSKLKKLSLIGLPKLRHICNKDRPQRQLVLPKPEMAECGQLWQLEKPFPSFYGLRSCATWRCRSDGYRQYRISSINPPFTGIFAQPNKCLSRMSFSTTA